MPQQPRTVYSDASVEPDTLPRSRWVCIDERGHIALVRTLDLDKDTLSTWLPRKTQHVTAETCCLPTGVLDCPEFFVGQDIIRVADNEASVSTIIRGTCTPDDINHLAEATMTMMALLRCRLWVEWMDSNSNPADGLSRQGLADPLFGTVALVASCPTWWWPLFAILQASFPAGHY